MNKLQLYSKDAALLLGLIAVQIALVPLITIEGVTPDVVLPGVVALALRRGQIEGTSYGFGSGLLLDLFVGELIGISALAKTVAGFTAGFYYDDDATSNPIGNARYIGIVGLTAVVHNAIFLVTYFRNVNVDFLEIVLLHGLGGAVYTTLVSVIPVLIISRKRRKLKV